LPYRIIWYPDTREHFRHLTARQRSIVFDSVEEQLVNEPTAETRNRKEIRPNSLASWELRIGDLRGVSSIIWGTARMYSKRHQG
jgi:mRNA-degrading endonuclease RelE of RelBE toxin-antitoxin system